MLRVLGPLEVQGPDGPMPVGGPVPRRILCALLVRPGAVVPVDSLVDAAWGDDPPPSAERTLISHITRLREALARLDGTAPPGWSTGAAATGWSSRLRLLMRSGSNKPSWMSSIWLRPRPWRRFARLWLPGARLPRTPICRTRRIRRLRRPGSVELHGAAVEALVAACLEADPAAAAAEAGQAS